MHTLWVREHNRIASELKKMNPVWNDETLFQTSRKITSAIWQHITYNEYVPFLTSLPRYTGYKSNTDPSITNVFATAAFRYGHSLVPNEFSQLNNDFEKQYEPISLQEAFFNRQPINSHGIEPTMRGLIGNTSRDVDNHFAFGIARRLFVKVGSDDHLDLAALNIQRGRDHGLPSYNEYRKFCGLSVAADWEDIESLMLPGVGAKLKGVYNSPDDIDIFVGGISENHNASSEVGPTFECIISQQFTALRDGDRFYYENPGVFESAQLHAIKQVTMSTVLCNNLHSIVSIQPKAFQTPESNNFRRICWSRIPQLDLSPWKDRYNSNDVPSHEFDSMTNDNLIFDDELSTNLTLSNETKAEKKTDPDNTSEYIAEGYYVSKHHVENEEEEASAEDDFFVDRKMQEHEEKSNEESFNTKLNTIDNGNTAHRESSSDSSQQPQDIQDHEHQNQKQRDHSPNNSKFELVERFEEFLEHQKSGRKGQDREK